MYRALIVDDEPMIQKGLEKLIGQVDPAIAWIDTAGNGLEALDKIADHPPDFLFTDIRMPKMDGLELCRSVYEQYKDIQIVVISGFGDFKYAQKCMTFGVKEYLLKPVNRTGVTETVRKLIVNQAQSRNPMFIPISTLEDWLDHLEEAVWHLQYEKVEETVNGMKDYCRSQGIELNQLKELTGELVLKLIKNLNRWDVYTFDPPASLPLTPGGMVLSDGEQCHQWLSGEIRQLMERIKAMRKGNMKEPVEEAKAYIERNLSKELTLEEVADKLGLNPSYFSQLFKQMTDETFVHYRTKRRMEKSKKLLAVPHYKITDISFEVGYADHPHFTKTFKKYTGVTPSEYRERLGMS